MLWYRRPTQPRPDTTSVGRAQQAFLYACCVHVTGALCTSDETNLCGECYSRLRTNIAVQQYRRIHRHFFVNGHTVRDEQCSSCGAVVVKTRPLDECISCVITACEFLDALRAESLSFDDYEYPLVLNIYDRTPVT